MKKIEKLRKFVALGFPVLPVNGEKPRPCRGTLGDRGTGIVGTELVTRCLISAIGGDFNAY